MSLQHIILSKKHMPLDIVDHSIELCTSCHWIELHAIGSEMSFDGAIDLLKKVCLLIRGLGASEIIGQASAFLSDLARRAGMRWT